MFVNFKITVMCLVHMKFIYDIFCLYNFTFVYLADYLNDALIIQNICR
jgi:hypothetical protein